MYRHTKFRFSSSRRLGCGSMKSLISGKKAHNMLKQFLLYFHANFELYQVGLQFGNLILCALYCCQRHKYSFKNFLVIFNLNLYQLFTKNAFLRYVYFRQCPQLSVISKTSSESVVMVGINHLIT